MDTAAPINEVLPVHVSRPLVDNSCVDSQTLCSLLGVKQLTVIELLKEIVFPDIESKELFFSLLCGVLLFQIVFIKIWELIFSTSNQQQLMQPGPQTSTQVIQYSLAFAGG